MTIKQRYILAKEQLKLMFPTANTELEYGSIFQLLIAVILSAQCTDKRVNTITPNLFAKYPDPQSMANASVDDIFELIKSVSYPNSKAKYLSQTAKTIVSKFNGQVPESFEDLTSLSGVGRKTANVILAIVYHKSTMPVDTHVHRVSARIGLTTNSKTVLQTEQQLIKHLAENDIALIHHQLILLGRYICKARKPLCEDCKLTEVCKFYLSKAKSKPNKRTNQLNNLN